MSLNKKLFGHWTFDNKDTSGGVLYDKSGSDHHAELSGGVTTGQNAIIGEAYSFDGNDDDLAIRDLFFSESGELAEMTVAAWVKVPSGGGDWAILDYDRSEYFTCSVDDNDTGPVFFATTDSGGSINDFTGNTSIQDGNWHHVAWVFDVNATNDKKIYLDGQLDAETSQHGGQNIGSGATRFGFIGNGSEAGGFDGSNNSTFYEGDIAEVRFYKKALSASEINRLYNDRSNTQVIAKFPDEASDFQVDVGRFLIDSTGNQTISGVGFEPDLIKFETTATNSSFDTDTTFNGQEWGWGHGWAKAKGGIDQFAISVGSGSSSTNGMGTASSSSFAIYQMFMGNGGASFNGFNEASLSSTSSDGFTINVNTIQQNQYVTYTAYKFENADEIDVGWFSVPTSTGNQSINTGFKPNFVNFFGQPNDGITGMDESFTGGSEDNGWGHGIACEKEDGSIEQVALANSMFANNIDDHVWASSDGDDICILRAESKGGVTGRIQASLSSFDSNGFTLNYSDSGSSQPVVYVAIKTKREPDVGFERTPLTEQEQLIPRSVNFQEAILIGSNTIDDINVEKHSGGNQSENQHGWMFGASDGETQRSMGFSSNSNSVNGHASGSRDGDAFHLLYTDQNGTIEGNDTGNVEKIVDLIDWSNIVTTSDGQIQHDQTLYAFYGFE